MSSRGDRPASLPRTSAKVGMHSSKNPASSHLFLDSAFRDNSVLRRDGQNSEIHTPCMNRSEQKKLLEENIRLKHELGDLRSQYEQLIEEGKNECFDERRVNLLKAQVLQLERQVVLLTEGLSSRAALLVEFNASLEAFTDKFSSFLSTKESALEVPIPRSEFQQIIEICDAMRQKLHRNQQTSDLSKLALPWTLGRNLITQPITLLDLCYGKIENLNLRYVSALEGKLSKLWRHLFAMRQTLSLVLAPGQGSSETAHHILPTAVYARLINQAVQCHRSVAECCSDLLTLTLLVPSAPWEILEYSLNQEFTVENVLATLPAFPKGGPQQRAKRAAEALVKAQNYSRQMAMQQIQALQAELNFHRNLYNLQVKYTDALFTGIKQAYHRFQDDVAVVLCSPLQDVLPSYIKLKTEASEAALKEFLTAFRNNAEQIQYAVETLASKNQQHEGEEALSRFGKEFFLSLEHSLKACGEQRDKAASEMETLQTELDQALEILRNLKGKKGTKPGPSQHFPKHEEGKMEEIKVTVLDLLSEKKTEPSSPSNFPPHSQSLLPNPATAEEKELNSSSSKLKLESSDDIQQKGKLIYRSKSMKSTARPPWQN